MTTLDKIDLFAEHRSEYVAKTKPALLKVSPAVYLSIAGKGKPGEEPFTTAIGALYGMAFTIKMTRKFAGEQDYAIGKLECLWGDEGSASITADMQDWPWQLMIRTPESITRKELTAAADLLTKRGKGARVHEVKLESLNEGLCVQALHVGPYDKECETVAAMQAFADANGLRLCGRHHEIYISDPRRIAPERLKTILRRPVS